MLAHEHMYTNEGVEVGVRNFGLHYFYAQCTRMEYKIYKTCNNKAEKCNA